MKKTPTLANRETDRSDSINGIRRRLAQAKEDPGLSADEVFDALKVDARDEFVSVAARRILEQSEW